MRGRIISKLRSDRGASLLMALLLFLICAVLGVVVLAAGTTASGRLSGLTAADRRYYAVRSAAELFRQTLDGQEQTVIRTKTQGFTVTWTDGAEPGAPVPDLAGAQYVLGNTVDTSFLETAVLDYVLGLERNATTDAEKETILTHTPGKDCSKDVYAQITVSPVEDGVDLVEVNVTVEMKNGALIFTFADASEKYRLSFTLKPTWQYTRTPQEYRVDGELTISTVQGDEIDPYTGEKVIICTYTQAYTQCTDNSVYVTWTASSIRQGAAK